MELTSGENENLAQLFGDGFLANLRAALTLDWPYSERARKTGGVAAAVLVLIGMREGVPSILITRRTESVETHKGQMAFPGGVSDPEDQADLMRTALRETEEEVGIPRRSVEVWGQLPPLYTVTGFWVTPIVGLLNQPVDQVGVSLNPDRKSVV